MPLYEYECKKCGALMERIQKFSDPPLTTCEQCGGKLERLVSSPAIQFKGSGWYVTDYARKASASSPAAPSNNPNRPAASESRKDSEPAAAKPSADTK